MSKEQPKPVKSRSQLQEKRKKEEKEKKKRARARKKAERTYEKKLAKQGRATKSRKTELDRYRETDKKLTIAIGITAVLFVLVLLLVFFV